MAQTRTSQGLTEFVSPPGRRAPPSKCNKTDQNEAEGLAQIVRPFWFRSIHLESLDGHRVSALLSARAQLIGMTTRLSNPIREVLKTFGLRPGARRGMRFDRKVEAWRENRSDVALIVRPQLQARSCKSFLRSPFRQSAARLRLSRTSRHGSFPWSSSSPITIRASMLPSATVTRRAGLPAGRATIQSRNAALRLPARCCQAR